MDTDDELDPQLLLRTQGTHNLEHLREWVYLFFRLLDLVETVVHVALKRIRVRLSLLEFERRHRVGRMRRINETRVVHSLDNLYARVLGVDIALERTPPPFTHPRI